MYTGVAYIFTIIMLVYRFPGESLHGRALTLVIVILIILGFNYYLCMKDLSFKKHFTEMLLLSLGVAVISFGVGIAVKHFLGIEINP